MGFWAAVAWSAVRPLNLRDYLLEIATPIGGFLLLAATYRRFPFTHLAYVLMFVEASSSSGLLAFSRGPKGR